MSTLNKLKKLFGRNIRYWSLGGIIVVLIALFSILSPSFFSVSTAMNTIKQTSILAIVAIGMTFIMLTGGIDLSVGTSIALSGVMAAFVMQQISGVEGALLGIAASLATGLLVGFINGLFIGVFRINPFMVTLATMSLASGLTLKFTAASRIMVDNDIYNWLGQKDILELIPGKPGIPGVLLLLVLLFVGANILLKRTVFGRRIYAVGGNIVASRASGINVRKQVMMAYILGGLFCGIGTIVTVGRVMSAQPLAAIGLNFGVITAVIIGGTSFMGGKGSLMGSLLGAIIVGIIATGLGMMNIPPFVNYIVKGVLILVAVLMNEVNTKAPSYKKKGEQYRASNTDKVMQLIKNNEQTILELKDIYKAFGDVKAVNGVSLVIKRGTVHALVGENGAGKSALIKVLSGAYVKDSGEISINGIPVDINSPMDSQKLGISVIYQEFSLVPELNVSQNIFLGKEILNRLKLFLHNTKMENRSKELLKRLNIMNINIRRRVNDYTTGQQQIIEITKVLGLGAWCIVMDEPTSAITETDKECLFKVIRELRDNGYAIVYISHRMPEIFEIADEVTILRDGQHVITAPMIELDEQTIIKHMVGRELTDIFMREKTKPGKVVLEVKNLYRKGVFESISFSVREGEVLGFSGLMGAGRTEIMRCIFGLDKPDGGKIFLDGMEVDIKNPFDAVKAGICFVSEDRRRESIVPDMTLRENITLPSLYWINKLGFINGKEDKSIAEDYISMLSIKSTSTEQIIGNLSGGNQQKCCLAKWLARKPRVLILDEPTRGIDVGAKSEIHKIIKKLTKENIAIIMISSELPEVIGVSNRIIVLYEGKEKGEFEAGEMLTQEVIMTAATGIVKDKEVS